MRLSGEYGVESTEVGKFNDSGYFHCKFWKKTVALLSLDFLHNGLSGITLEAEFAKTELNEPALLEKNNYNSDLLAMLSHLNVCSKESPVRKFDHEVQGMSIIKPFEGAEFDGPSDAAVVRPVPESCKGIAVSNGINPEFGPLSCYHMAANCIDEAI